MSNIVSLFALVASYVVYNRVVTIPAGLALHFRPGIILLRVKDLLVSTLWSRKQIKNP